MSQSKRDPRVDPRPGDVVLYGPQWQRERVEVIGTSNLDVDCRMENGAVTYFNRVQWGKFMVGAEVLHVA